MNDITLRGGLKHSRAFSGTCKMGVEFNTHCVDSRKDLIDFVREDHRGDILKDIGSNFERWIEELSGINQMITGGGLVAAIGIRLPPTEDKEFKKIGDNIFFYSGENKRLRGFWTQEKREQWTQYHLGSKASLKINTKSENISLEDLLPQNFELKSEKLRDTKRPIFKFKVVNKQGVEETIYAKGSEIIKSFYYPHSKPSYRLTNLSQIQKITSKREADKTIVFMENGIKVPEIVGYYTSNFEEFLFLKEMHGEMPDECFSKHRHEIIKQDAIMLAKLCKLGYRKPGFEDFDDKIFDGKDLYLIDVDEVSGLYYFEGIDFRKILLDHTGKSIREFKKYQKGLFIKLLKDTVYEYRDNMLVDEMHRKQYIRHFSEEIGWKLSEKEIKDLLTYPKNYITYSSNLSMMLDTE